MALVPARVVLPILGGCCLFAYGCIYVSSEVFGTRPQTLLPKWQQTTAQQVFCKEREASSIPVVLDPISNQVPPGWTLPK